MIDDPSLISAYLDDELDPADRRRVASALRDDPALARQLRALAAVRDLVADLDRPAAPADVPMAVVLRIDRRRSVRHLLTGVASLSAAAGVFLALSLSLPSLRDPLWGEGVVPAAGPAVEVADSGHRPSPPVVVAEPTPTPTPVPDPVVEPAPPAALAGGVLPPLDRLGEIREGRYHALFDHADATRFVVPVGGLDDADVAAIDRIVRSTVRRNPHYSVVRVPAALAIAPEPPGDAVVFVLSMDEAESRQLVDRLGRVDAVRGPIPRSEPSPDLLLQLADLDSFELNEGVRGSLLVESPAVGDPRLPDSRMFIRFGPNVPDPSATERRAVRPGPRNPAGPPPNSTAIPPRPDDLPRRDRTVLLWLTATPADR